MSITLSRPVSGLRVPRLVSSRRLPVAAAGLAAGLLAAVHVARPELDPSWVPISDFALGRHGWLMNGAFIAWGAATVTAALSVWPRVRGRLARAGLVLVLIGGLWLVGYTLDYQRASFCLVPSRCLSAKCRVVADAFFFSLGGCSPPQCVVLPFPSRVPCCD